jgi:NADH-quinone oxidoreductase subunit F
VVHRGAGAYICGEETALLDSLEGKRGNPRLKPPFPANQGLYQGPTLINNVETLATAPAILRMGGEEYAKLGAPGSTGTKLVSVSGTSSVPGNYEIELGISSREIIYGLAGGPPEGRTVKLWFPAARARRCSPATTSTSPTTSTRWPRPARCSARAPSSSSTTPPRWSTSH